jgi:ATP-dependent DNA helicase RecG
MLVEGAERFGLAQLHQFRGRVGRGLAQAYCIMISAAAEGDDGARRLMAMEATTDGFALAQTDLEMRGPGDFFGTRQSGLPRLHAAQLGDLATLEAARSAARRIYDVDPHLTLPEHATLAAVVAALWEGAGEFN